MLNLLVIRNSQTISRQMFPNWQILCYLKSKNQKKDCNKFTDLHNMWYIGISLMINWRKHLHPMFFHPLKNKIDVLQPYNEMQNIIVKHEQHLKFNSSFLKGTIRIFKKVCNDMQKIQTDLNKLHSKSVSVQHLFQNIYNWYIYIFTLYTLLFHLVW